MTVHRTPSLPGSSRQDSPSLAGWGIAAALGDLGDLSVTDSKPLYERLRCTAEPPRFEAFGVTEQTLQAFYRAMGYWVEGGAHGFWLEPESGDGHCDPEAFVYTIATRMHELSSAFNGDQIKSPIEAQLFAALLWSRHDWAGFPMFDAPDRFAERGTPPSKEEGVCCYITPQGVIAGWKVDLVLWFEYGRHRGGVAIECDGHEFHEKTKEQAARDKKRDRDIVCAGYPMLRFTGSEIYRDPVACANQVKEAASEALYRVSKDGGLF